MASLREIRLKIKSVRQTQKVTKAMKMIAAARLKKAQSALLASRPYAYKVEDLIQDIRMRLDMPQSQWPELMRQRPHACDKMQVVLSSDRGLCGSYNVSLLRLVLEYYRSVSEKGGKAHFFVVGKKGRDFLASHNFFLVREYLHFMRQFSFAQAELLSREVLNYYRENKNIGEVSILFTDFRSLIKQTPKVISILPIPATLSEDKPERNIKDSQRDFDFIYEPERELILESLLPRYVMTQMARTMLEAYTSEQASRMNVMENATRNAGDLIEELTLLGNKVRQSSITREILEVVSGAEALVS